MEFSRQEYWSEYFLQEKEGIKPDPGIEPTSSALQEYSLLPESQEHAQILLFSENHTT